METFINALKTNPKYKNKITAIFEFEPQPGIHCNCQKLNNQLQQYLAANNIKLYEHQCIAIKNILEGNNIIISTSTASGKTLAFNLPIVQTLQTNTSATALYIYPTKALSNDQLNPLKSIEKFLSLNLNPSIYDGDSSSAHKSATLTNSRIIFTNPYEIHNILAWHFKWSRIFSNLKFIVIDEAHQYRGVFGSNVALLLRRLLRILNHYGSNPQFILASATLANPLEFSNKLTGKNFVLVNKDSSQKQKKFFLFLNPFQNVKNINSVSFVNETSKLLANLVFSNKKTLVFTTSRRTAELIAKNTQDLLKSKNYFNLAKKISPYRAGYLPYQRREIEKNFRSGKLLALVSTNALELGIDIGDIDAVIIAGYPGTLISTMQQAGRTARKKPGMVIFIAKYNQLDQYLVRHPNSLFDKPIEHAIIDLQNKYITTNHIICAASELPITQDDTKYFPPTLLKKILKHLTNKNILKKTNSGFTYSGLTPPTKIVSLNAISSNSFQIIENGKIIETIDQIHAFTEAHQNAVFLHKGQTYIVTDFNLKTKIIKVKKQNVNYYTKPLKQVQVKITKFTKSKTFGSFTFYLGHLNITEQIIGYVVKQNEKVIGGGDLNLPPNNFSTTGLWFFLPEKLEQILWQKNNHKPPSIPSLQLLSIHNLYDPSKDLFAGGLHGTEHAIIGTMPLFVMADRWDLGGLSTIFHIDTQKPTIFVYDGYPGGIGLCEKALNIMDSIIKTAYQIVSQCPCTDGCPACIMSPKCGNDNRPLDKRATIFILNYILEKINQNN